MTRQGALLVLTGLWGETTSQLETFDRSPVLKHNSPKTYARLQNLAHALHLALEDMHRANDAELTQ